MLQFYSFLFWYRYFIERQAYDTLNIKIGNLPNNKVGGDRFGILNWIGTMTEAYFLFTNDWKTQQSTQIISQNLLVTVSYWPEIIIIGKIV